MNSVAQEAAEAWPTVEQVDKLRRVQSRVEDDIARVGSTKEGKTAVVGRRDQGSSARSDCSKPCGSCWNYRKENDRMANCTTKRKSGPSEEQKRVTPEPGSATPGQQSSFQQSL